jgi:hypothetical protein
MALHLAGPFQIPGYESHLEPSPRARQLRACLIDLLESELADPTLTLQDALDALHGTTLWFADDRDGDAA